MGRILAIDYGGKRTGLAVTDPLQIIATALETIPSSELIPYLKKYVNAEQVDAFVIGEPKNLDGSDTDASSLVKNFLVKLNIEFPQIPVHLIDERFTSKMAVQSMIASGTSKKDRRVKGNIDKISATIILQDFMSRQH
ncbi:Holliday junction resolvase RuvX [uncultured Arcticibacterium sp.]|uniref:Holliday junction resolvase RuvX n=1 Tax=uncultured Arcticibacterium sp. TaxID=2173042 RepID=UPI0030F4C496